MSKKTPKDYMSQALNLAAMGRLTCSPNPMVGCLIVKNNQIIGSGYHQIAGQAHAEPMALREAGTAAKGATAYVTLEPCCHHGRTPPCTDALIAAGIKKIYVATLDPNPLVAGKGIKQLQAAGIEIEIGLLAKEARELNEIFFHYMKHQRPFVIAKWAMSLDGKTITHPDDDKNITHTTTQPHAHLIRQQVDAIMIGANTAIQDNPQLTARAVTTTHKQPIRIIVSSRCHLPDHLTLLDAAMPAKTLIATTSNATAEDRDRLAAKGADVLVLPQNTTGQVDLTHLLKALAERQITSVLIEGGMTLLNRFFETNLINKIHVYLAPVIIGDLKNKKHIPTMTLSSLTPDLFINAHFEDTTHV